MKKKLKKLELSRETLSALSENQVQEAVGASGGGLGYTYCLTECGSYNTCGTRYC
jgi:hypothetical protein